MKTNLNREPIESSTQTALWRKHKAAIDIPLLLVSSIVLLGLGLFLPVITLTELAFWKHTFSVLTGIANLFSEKHYVLALVVFVFSIIFPITKLLSLCAIWFLEMTPQKRELYIQKLGIMGKWSMLDVFVVAMTVVIAKISGMASARPEIGIYFFGASIVCSIVATTRIESLIKQRSLKSKI